jgi:hypothetical protein
MTYFIFLKYLRSLEGFRKNPHVKIPPKSPCANFQSLGIFKNLILFKKEFSSDFGPSDPAPPPRWPAPPRRPPTPRSAHSTEAALAYFLKGVFSSTLRTSVETPSLSHVTAIWGPPVSFIPFPMSTDHFRFFSSPSATPRHPASNLGMPSKVFTPRLDSPS